MFGFKKEDGNPYTEYGLETLGAGKAQSFLETAFKTHSSVIQLEYRAKASADAKDDEFFSYLNVRATYDIYASYLKVVRQSLIENRVNNIVGLPDLAKAKLCAYYLTLLIATDKDQETKPLVPASARASQDIAEWTRIAANIKTEQAKIQAERTREDANSKQRVTHHQEIVAGLTDRIRILQGKSITLEEKYKILNALSPDEVFEIACNSEIGFEDVGSLIYIFSNDNCELGTAVTFLEEWSHAEPWDTIAFGETNSTPDYRKELFTVFGLIIKKINAGSYRNDHKYFGTELLEFVKATIKQQQNRKFEGKFPLYEINPDCLARLQQLTLNK